jgi:galactokinase
MSGIGIGPDDFEARFGRPPEVVVRSPGRVNIIGEHTDYNDGWVLPAAIDRGTDVLARRRGDRELHVTSLTVGETDVVSLDDLRPTAGPPWARYVRGAAALLQDSGVDVPACDVLLGGDLPLGAGLSSSASVTLGVLTTFAALGGGDLDPLELARIGQLVENDVVGVASGIMDQLAVACGRADHALLIDCRAVAIETVSVPVGLRLLVLDSGVPRRLAESGYNQRRAECERAVTGLRQIDPSITALRDATPELLAAAGDRLDSIAARRARHVITEDQRVLDAVAALRDGDGAAVGRLLAASHASLRDDYEVSIDELDVLVEVALEEDGVLGARLTGAGFGGCAVALVDAPFAEPAAERIAARYRERTGRPGAAFACAIADGVHTVPA